MRYELALQQLNPGCCGWTWPTTDNRSALCPHQRMRAIWLAVPEFVLEGEPLSYRPIARIGFMVIEQKKNGGNKYWVKFVPTYRKRYAGYGNPKFNTEDELQAFMKLIVDEN